MLILFGMLTPNTLATLIPYSVHSKWTQILNLGV